MVWKYCNNQITVSFSLLFIQTISYCGLYIKQLLNNMPVSYKCVGKGHENIFSRKKAIDNDAGIEEEESKDVPVGE